MLYVVELDFTLREQVREWDAWYLEHLAILLAVPGFGTAQRFRCLSDTASPLLAAYSVSSPQVFESAEYRARGGRDSVGAWKTAMINWHRNLYGGIGELPDVDANHVLLVSEDAAAPGRFPEAGLRVLTCEGLDRSLPVRAMAVVPRAAGEAVAARSGGSVRAYESISPRYLPGMLAVPA